MRITFLYPPQTLAFMPPLGPASLIAYLASEIPEAGLGFIDLNLDHWYWLTSRPAVARALDRLQGAPGIGSAEDRAAALAAGRAYLEGEPDPLDAFRSEAVVTQPPAFAAARGRLRRLLALHALAGGAEPHRDSPDMLAHPFDESDANALLHGLRGDGERAFQAFLDQHPHLRPAVAASDVIAISVTMQEQMAGALALAAFVRQVKPSVTVLAGGSWITAIRNAIKAVPEFFDDIDAFIPFSGEATLVQAIRALGAGDGLGGLPNVMLRTADGVQVAEARGFPRIVDLPDPDFSHYRLDRYLLPAPLLPVQASRGCYWGKCTFCSHHLAQGERYSAIRAEAFVARLRRLHDRHGVRHFYFVDEALPPTLYRTLPGELRRQGLDIRWMSECRMEKTLSPDVFAGLADSGCRLLLFGLESGSPAVGAAMRKGVDLEVASRVLGDCAAAGIHTNLFLMVGFPTETDEDAMRTLDFVAANRAAIDNVGLATFFLTAESPIALAPAEYGVTLDLLPPDCRRIADTVPFAAATSPREHVLRLADEMDRSETMRAVRRDRPFARREHAVFLPPRRR